MVSNRTKGDTAIKKLIRIAVSVNESKVCESVHESTIVG